jgi:mono/diheme cytochrome c family protein
VKIVSILGAATIIFSFGFGADGALADEAPVEFTAAYLNDPAVFEQGKEIWFKQCTHCHGFKAYPGKAPKLKPKRYTPEFVYKRVSKGFKKMPAWESVYKKEELMAVVAYVKNRKFSP